MSDADASMDCPRPNYRAGRELRLSRRDDIAAVFHAARRAGDGRLTLLGLARTGGGPSRMAVAVGRRYGKAVLRNRAKRLCREAFRLSRCSLPAGIDFVMVPRVGVQLTLADLRESLVRLAGRVASQCGRRDRSTQVQGEAGPGGADQGDGQ